jgi:hypothetical protein
MGKKNMDVKHFVKIYDDVIPNNVLSNFLKYANQIKFEQAGLSIGDKNYVDKSERNVGNFGLNNNTPSLTEAHWYNFVCALFHKLINQYIQDTNVVINIDRITDVEILKYEKGGFYKYHTDHCLGFPRTLSGIFLLNDDYEGGELCFKSADRREEQKIEVKANRFILWPSNFLYPHTVMPVIEGTRYSVVCWAL